MRKYLFLFCLFLICIAIDAQSFTYKYLYFGDANGATKSYVRINKDPVVLTFIEKEEAIQLVWEGDNLVFYVKDVLNMSENETLITAVQKGSNIYATFYLKDSSVLLILGKYAYLITDIQKPKY